MKIAKSAPKSTLTIAKVSVTVPQPFAIDHPLTAGEAAALNQTFRENVRNNTASAVKKLGDSPTPEAAQEIVNAYIASYEFGVRRSSTGDPVEKEALRLARHYLPRVLAAQNPPISAKDLDKTAKASYVEKLLSGNPAIYDEAKKNVANAKSIGELALS